MWRRRDFHFHAVYGITSHDVHRKILCRNPGFNFSIAYHSQSICNVLKNNTVKRAACNWMRVNSYPPEDTKQVA